MAETPSEPCSSRRTTAAGLAIVAVLLVAAAVVFTKDAAVGGFRWGDAPSHAMDGVLIRDWMTAGPQAWLQPRDFAERQYAYYPTLSMGQTYPPGFAIFEGLFFWLFGVSAAVARLTTACFGVAAIFGAYLVARRLQTSIGAVCTAGALLAMPSIVLWTRQTMLEMPTLAVLIWLTYAVQAYLAVPTWPRCIVVILLLLGSPFFKQTAVFIVPVVGIVMFVQAWRRCIPWRHFTVASCAVGVPLAAMLLLMLRSNGSGTHLLEVVTSENGATGWLNWTSLLYYPRMLPAHVGCLVLCPAAAGLVISLRRLDWSWGLVLLWFAAFMLMITYIQHKQPRYLFFACFPIAMWTGLAMDRAVALFRRRLVPSAIVISCMACLVVRAYGGPIPHRPDYGALVATHADKIRGHIVFFEGRRDGDFIFAVREQLGPRQAVIVRGSKILYSCAADTRWRYTSYVANRYDVAETLDKFAFSALFVERENATVAVEVGLLQDYLSTTSTYTRVGTQVLSPRGTGRMGVSRTIDVYAPQTPLERSVRFMEIPMPIASQSIRVDLDELTAELKATVQAG